MLSEKNPLLYGEGPVPSQENNTQTVARDFVDFFFSIILLPSVPFEHYFRFLFWVCWIVQISGLLGSADGQSAESEAFWYIDKNLVKNLGFIFPEWLRISSLSDAEAAVLLIYK